jgi:YihY family inner membrane protein
MNIAGYIRGTIGMVDRWQRRHMAAGFCYGVVKKYGDDEAGYKAALLTYYGFLSLFPLLLVLASIVSSLAAHHVPFGERLLTDTAAYVPLIGHDVVSHIHTIGGNGFALTAGILLTLFGARGVADVFRSILDHVWAVPYHKRAGFPIALGRSLGMILVGGVGLLVTSTVTGFVVASGHALPYRITSILIALIGMFGVFCAVMRIGMSLRRPWRYIALSAVMMTVGIEVLQLCGGYIVAHELHRLDGLYGTFAVVLGLFFWLYLQAQVILYGLEATTVTAFRLWPRNIAARNTQADAAAARLYEALRGRP